MALFERELETVLNPAYGASLLYAFVRGHEESAQAGQGMPIPHLFVALTLLLNPRVVDALAHTRSGLRNVAEKLDSSPETGADLLRSLLTESKTNRELTLQSLQILMVAGLVRLDTHRASVYLQPANDLLPPLQPEGYIEGLKLGRWFATLSVFEITSIMKVVY